MMQPSAGDMDKVGSLITGLYEIIDGLEELFPGRSFTPDGHLVGSIGESLAAYVFDLKLMQASNTGFDAKTRDGRTVEIKATQGTAVALYDSSAPNHLIVLRISRTEPAEIVYNGPAEPAWKAAGGAQKNGQRRIYLSTLRKILVEPGQELEVVHPLPPLGGSTNHSG